MTIRIFVFLLTVILILSFVVSCNFNQTEFDTAVGGAIADYEFSLARFQLFLLRDFLRKEEDLELAREEEVEIVLNYFNGDHKEKRVVEKIIAKQIEEVLTEEGIFLFPKVRFSLVSLPGYLIISPRDEIRRKKEMHVIPELSAAKKEEIEEKVDALGVSSYISDLSGTPTFPIVIDRSATLKSTIEIVTHEWVHQYLFFRPLGFRYALHFIGWPDDDIAAINEAVADIVEQEVAEKIYYGYYSPNGKRDEKASIASAFDFRSEMRNIRKEADSLLLQGKIEEAERYMEEQRLYINSQGYNIRKLNQAYFAFHGTYPSISVNPLTERVKEIRNRSDSLKDFLIEIAKTRKAEELLKTN
jgi:hypothetical protein